MVKGMICAASLLLAMPGTAFAEQKLPDVAVSYGDLDLTKPEDIRLFDRRLSWAIMSACPEDRGVGRRNAVRACRAAKREEVAVLRTRALAAAATRGDVAAADTK